jgi:hypothetical protein
MAELIALRNQAIVLQRYLKGAKMPCACSKLVNAADNTDFWYSRRGTSGHDHLSHRHHLSPLVSHP